MPTVMQLGERMSILLSELIMNDVTYERKNEIISDISSLADQIRAHKNVSDIVYAELWIQVENDEEWEVFGEDHLRSFGKGMLKKSS